MGWKDHRLIEDGEERFCAHCTEPWPCPTAALVAEVQAELKEPEQPVDRIEWKHDSGPSRNSHIGSVAGKHLFTIGRTMIRTNGGGWTLRTPLPWGVKDVEGTVDEQKARAERILTAFVHKIGARWPGPGEAKES